jgi:hypothetical protein
MEESLFNWTFRSCDEMRREYSNVVLNRRIGKYKKDTYFPSAVIDYYSSMLKLYDENKICVGAYKLKLTIGG